MDISIPSFVNIIRGGKSDKPNPACIKSIREAKKWKYYYEPGVNLAYQDLAEYYKFAVLPARVKRPKDKGAGKWCTKCGTLGNCTVAETAVLQLP